MTLNSFIALFSVMLVLAAVPGVSVLAVTTRAISYGFVHGIYVTLGIVLGDIVFIVLAIFGLSLLAESLGAWFVLVQYLAGAILIWFGLSLWRFNSETVQDKKSRVSSTRSSFLTGFLITLGDQKAVLFYMGFFPAFLDVSALSPVDVGLVITAATLAIVVAKLSYAYIAARAGSVLNAHRNRLISKVAGSVMIVTGVFLIAAA